jgi:type II secretory pathway component GspD/PulD (secretin)
MRLTLSLLLCAAAFAQEQTRTYTFANTQDSRQMQETLNMIRSMVEIRNVAVDPVQRTLTASGTPEQISLTTWLFTEVDRPPSRPPAVQVRDNSFPDPRAPQVKIFYYARLANPQQVQEVVNAIRSVSEIQRCFSLTGSGAILVRGSAEQVALAESIVRELDGSLAGARPKGVREYTFEDTFSPPERRTPAVRVYYPSSAGTAQDIVDLVNGLRSIAEIQRAVAFTASGAIVIRGSADQAKLTDWLVRELDQPTAGGSQYQWAGSTIRAAYLKHSDTAALVKQIREIGIQRVVSYPRQRALVIRGFPAQVAAAEPLLQ